MAGISPNQQSRVESFWDRLHATDNLALVMLALPSLALSLAILNQLRDASSDVRIAATARFPGELESLSEAGASKVLNIYAEAGSGSASRATTHPATRRKSNAGVGAPSERLRSGRRREAPDESR